MSTWTDLTEELSACERRLTAVRLKAEERLEKENKKVQLVKQKRQDCDNLHEQALERLRGEYDKQMMAIQRKADEEIKLADSLGEVAIERQQASEHLAEVAEVRWKQLNDQLKELNVILAETRQEQSVRHDEVRIAADHAVQQKVKDANFTIRQASISATDMQEGANDSIEMMQDKSRGTLRAAELKSMERSRYKELYNAVMTRQQMSKSDNDVREVRQDLLSGWHKDWIDVHESSELHQPRALLQQAVNKRIEAKTPVEERPRSMDRARQRAVAEARHKHVLRPLTAP